MTSLSRTHLRAIWILATIAIACVVVAVYFRGLFGPFLMDDFGAIFPLLGAQAAGEDWLDILRSAPHHVRSRWVANLSFLIGQAATGDAAPSAFAAKAGNLALHLANAVVVGALARSLALLWGATRQRALATALMAAALFALHPLLASTVLYAVQRMAQLATLFSLLAVLAYLHWRQRLATASPAAHFAGLASIAAVAGLAFFSKESGALVPLLIGVVELTAFRWPSSEVPWRSRFDTGFGLLCAAPLVLGFVALGMHWESFMAGYASRDFDLPTRLLTQIEVVAGYVQQIAWPRLADMGLYHDDLVPVSTPTPSTIALGLLHLAVIVAAIAGRRRWPWAAFAALWFYASHVIESSLIPLELVFEHRNYMALAGIAVGVAYWIAMRRRAWQAGLLAIALCAPLAVQTARRAIDWSDHERWLAAEASHHPASLRVATDIFVNHLAHGRLHEAAQHRTRMVETFPDRAQPVLLKLAFACRGPIATRLFEPNELAALERLPIGKDAFHSFSALRDLLARDCPEPDWQTVALAARTVGRRPDLLSSSRAAAAWWRLAADAHQRAGDWAGARSAVEEVLRLETDDPRDWLLLAEASARNGDYSGYLRARQQLLRLLPGGGPLAPDLTAVDRLAATLVPPAQP